MLYRTLIFNVFFGFAPGDRARQVRAIRTRQTATCTNMCCHLIPGGRKINSICPLN